MSARPEDAIVSLHEWLKYADNDLLAGGRDMQAPPLPGDACFHAQQAAEKALKGYLAWLSDGRIPRVHDLSELAAVVIERGGATPPAEAVAALNDYAVGPRYPERPPPTEHEAREALHLATDLVAWVREQVRLADAASPDAPRRSPPSDTNSP